MDRLSKYSIPFAGLATGSHQFDYEIDEQFFEAFGNSEIDEARVRIGLDFNKSDSVLTLTFRINGYVKLACDRCTELLDLTVETDQVLLIRFGDEESQVNDDIIVIGFGEHQINVAQLIYDYLCLQIPMKVVHPDDEYGNSTCNPEIIKLISGAGDKIEKSADPRWEALNSLAKRKN
jgi:uncharacterized metal-binding protein YceD (DUF177 family)